MKMDEILQRNALTKNWFEMKFLLFQIHFSMFIDRNHTFIDS